MQRKIDQYLTCLDTQPTLISGGSLHWAKTCLEKVDEALRAPDADKLFATESASAGFWYATDDPRAWLRPYNVVDGILIIPVKGVLLFDFPYQLGSWATGYEYIWEAAKRGQADANVRGMATISDTPGGLVAGCFDLVDKLTSIENRKPFRAFVNTSAYSAGYAVISSADHISVSRVGGVGSIGVLITHIDVSKMEEAMGIKRTFVTQGKGKTDGSPFLPLSEDAKARMEERGADMYGLFVARVAENRNLSEEEVRNLEAYTYGALDAVKVGLADSVGEFEESLAGFAAEIAGLATNHEDDTMPDEDKKVAAQAVDAARAEGYAEGQKAGRTEGVKEGAKAERERISAILATDAGKARPQSALAAAFDTELSVEAAATFLAKLPVEEKAASSEKSNFEEAMDRSQNPDLGAPGEGANSRKTSRAQAALETVFPAKKAS